MPQNIFSDMFATDCVNFVKARNTFWFCSIFKLLAMANRYTKRVFAAVFSINYTLLMLTVCINS